MIKLTKQDRIILIGKLENLYTFDLDGYKIPKMTRMYNDIQDLRDKLLLRCSMKEQSFLDLLSQTILENNMGFECYFIRQFPFILEERKLWENCCNECGCPYKIDQGIIFTDIYFPRLNKVIEIDYKITHQDPNYDKARDLYLLRKYGIETCRIYNFNNGSRDDNIVAKYNIYNLLKSAIHETNNWFFRIDYKRTLIELFKIYSKNISHVINYIREKYGYNRRNIRLNKNEPILGDSELMRFLIEVLQYLNITITIPE
jgi:very-short-patch-repair endonuclease